MARGPERKPTETVVAPPLQQPTPDGHDLAPSASALVERWWEAVPTQFSNRERTSFEKDWATREPDGDRDPSDHDIER